MKIYTPLDLPKQIAPGLWVVDGPIVRLEVGPIAMPFPTRMVIARLAGGALWVWSPTALSSELRARVDARGTVGHLVSPNRIHYAHVAAWKASYPDAIAWASPGVRGRAAAKGIKVDFDRDLGDAPDAAWAAEIDQLVFRGSRVMDEVVFFHRASRTLVVADLIENFEPEKLTFPERIFARLGGVTDPDGKAPADYRATFAGHRDEARASVRRLLAWSPARVVIAHGRWYERDGARELRRAFRWVE
jgi:hypothetical protein